MSRFRCPDRPLPDVADEDQILGCGRIIDADADDEGLVDCPACGIWFRATEGGGA